MVEILKMLQEQFGDGMDEATHGFLQIGDNGAAVTELQTALSEQGYPVTIDGDFGDETQQAVVNYQENKGLVVDGAVGNDTISAIKGKNIDRALKEADIQKAANFLGVDKASIKAITRVESRGHGYLKNGKVIILFERHIFYKQLKSKHGEAYANKIAHEQSDICNRVAGGYEGGNGEYPRFNRAFAIDAQCAMKSASWGLFQIMGFNHKAAGFDTVDTFVDAMKSNEGAQLLAFCHFVKDNPALHRALKAKNWATVAQLYNGAAYRKNQYDIKLTQAHQHFKALA